MRYSALLAVVFIGCTTPTPVRVPTEEHMVENTVENENTVNNVKKLTPMLFVESIEASLPFWIERLGFTKTMEVPQEGGEGLVFVLLAHGPAAVMLQTYASVKDDAPHLVGEVQKGPSFLFVEVTDLAALEPRLAGVEVVVPKHETSYGATEISVREPGGHLITLAQVPQRE